MLNDRIRDKLLTTLQKLRSQSDFVFDANQLNTFYETFRKKFHPDILVSWNGEEMLNNFYLFSSRDSLAYWLEFKNDAEMTLQFGSIAGGSALKYGIYFNSDRQVWSIGPPTNQKSLSIPEAIEYVKKQRAQLLAGYEILNNLSSAGTIDDYRSLQKNLTVAMPDLVDYAWVHKYFSMLFPIKLDDFHNPTYQRYYLIKMLILPDETEGRYANAFHYVQIAKELNIPINSLTTALWQHYGNPVNYWRIGTTAGENDRWELMKENNCIAVGWDKINKDLSDFTKIIESKQQIKELCKEAYPDWVPQKLGNQSQQLFKFVTTIAEGDYAIAMNGSKVRGVGVVTGRYYYQQDAEYFRHRIPVKWLSLDEWKLDNPEGLQTTVFRLKKNVGNIISFEKKIQLGKIPEIDNETKSLSPFAERILSVLERKGQVILYGPPGTGKTYHAFRIAEELIAKYNTQRGLTNLSIEERKRLREEFVFSCSFHPGYGYEDFIEAYKPTNNNAQISFELRDGIFKKLCLIANKNKEKKYFLIVDEINRGDIPRIFGELISLIELDKRNVKFLLPVSGQEFFIPENIFIIATMNTADRSIALLDSALRRRFGFVEMMPDYSILKGITIDGVSLEIWLKTINNRIKQNLGQNGRNYQIGHSYLLTRGKPITDIKSFTKIVNEDIIPLIEEYCYDDYSLLEKILGRELFDQENSSINRQLFEMGNWEKIKKAICFNDPEILEKTASENITTEEDEESESEIGDDSSET